MFAARAVSEPTLAEKEAAIDVVRSSIMTAVLNNFGYLRAHPPVLAWTLMNLEMVTQIAARHVGTSLLGAHDFAKRSARGALNDQDFALLARAAALTVFSDGTFYDPVRLPSAYEHPMRNAAEEFAGYTRAERALPPELAEPVVAYRGEPLLQDHVAPFMRGMGEAWMRQNEGA